MSGTAKLLSENGWEVTGSDRALYSPMREYITTLPFTVYTGFSPKNIPKNTDIIVIGKNAGLVPEKNIEVRAAFESGIPIKSFPAILEELTKNKHTIIAAGSFGKSTCTALLAWILNYAGKDASYLVGALPSGMSSAHIGKSDLFVLEGDEYPTSNTDPSSKFLHYNPKDILLTSANHDHFDVFKTHEDFLLRFQKLIALMPENGLLVACSDNEPVRKLVVANRHVITYGLDQDHTPIWSAEDIQPGEVTQFTLTKHGKTIAKLSTTLLGKHNIQNIVGVAALLLERKLVTNDVLIEAVRAFEGIARRLDQKTKKSSVVVYEGFGSSFDKARSAIEAIQLHSPNKRLITIFEPHTFSWRNPTSLDWYATAFSGSSHLVLYHETEKRMVVVNEITIPQMVEQIENSGITTSVTHNPTEGIDVLKTILKENDVVLILSSGGMSGLIDDVVQYTEETFPL